ncbi:hypothetical protein [Roseovarius atlanticus]|uniref:hypothetical protein n=1 Tax=Roseovarius atlanticus TaxID=1641875 RepID=UPI001C95D81C|nr:hypothetical protein [Roseovarius atlanticus]MBY5988458.1 hypothetical protein [Roseovarius atlanticus]MBY6123849.1 hypothetical protein [Roseovarius atlanticus]MBY6148344.1 hypothetical protein [Roseovarius atlanticus]
MKKIIVAAAVASLLFIEPGLAGGLADPVLDQQVVADAAVEDSTAKVDLLMLTLLYIFFLASAGGAF